MSKRVPPQKHVDPEPEDDEDEIIEDEEEEEPFDLVSAMNGMDPVERVTVYGLRGINVEIRKLRKQMNAELAALNVELATKSKPLFTERLQIVSGLREPTAAEVAAGTDVQASTVEEVPSDEDDKAKKPAPKKKAARVVSPGEESKKEVGITNFWLTAMRNNEVLESLITERDAEALAFLEDVTSDFIDGNPDKGFVLKFAFGANKFFSDSMLSKTYRMDGDDSDVLDKSEGCAINWTSPQTNLTIEIKQKKQRSKTGKGIRVVQREEKSPSFFRFFSPVDPDTEDAAADDEENFDIDPEFDYEAGVAFKDALIPRAVHYFTGESIAQMASGMNFGGDDDDDDENEEEEEEEEEDPTPVIRKKGGGGGGGGAKPAPKQADCKQQ